MPSIRVDNVRVLGVSLCLPKRTEDLLENKITYGGDKKRLQVLSDTSGFRFRKVADSDQTSSDFYHVAAEDILTKLDIDRSTIKHLIVVTQSPQYLFPGDASFLHGDLGLSKDCTAISLNYGCSGYIYGLWLASTFANQSQGKVLLLVGDISNIPHLDENINGTYETPIFGDGGSATIIDYDANAAPMFFDLASDGAGAKTIWFKYGLFRHQPSLDRFDDNGNFLWHDGSRLDGMAVLDFSLREVPPSIEKTLAFAGWGKDDVSAYFLHQSNKIIIENIAAVIGQPMEKFPVRALYDFGNLSSASIPSAMIAEYKNALEGVPKKYILCGYGVGLSWATAAVELGNMYMSEIIEI